MDIEVVRVERVEALPWVYDDGGREAAGFRGETGDCMTRAAAIATGRPYREIYDMVNELGARERPRKGTKSSARTGVRKPTTRKLLAELGFSWRPTMAIGSGCTVHLRVGEVPATGIHILSVSRHVVALIDGVLHDSHDPGRDGDRCVYGIWSLPDTWAQVCAAAYCSLDNTFGDGELEERIETYSRVQRFTVAEIAAARAAWEARGDG